MRGIFPLVVEDLPQITIQLVVAYLETKKGNKVAWTFIYSILISVTLLINGIVSRILLRCLRNAERMMMSSNLNNNDNKNDDAIRSTNGGRGVAGDGRSLEGGRDELTVTRDHSAGAAVELKKRAMILTLTPQQSAPLEQRGDYSHGETGLKEDTAVTTFNPISLATIDDTRLMAKEEREAIKSTSALLTSRPGGKVGSRILPPVPPTSSNRISSPVAPLPASTSPSTGLTSSSAATGVSSTSGGGRVITVRKK